MYYDAELSFFQSLLKNFHLNVDIISSETIDLSCMDQGLWKLLGLEKNYEILQNFLKEKIKSNTIYKITDTFYCTYIFLQLPDTSPSDLLMIGPYTTIELTRHNLLQLTEKYRIPAQLFSTFEKYFFNIPYLTGDSLLIVALNTLGEKLWGNINHFTFETIEPGMFSGVTPFSIQTNLEEYLDSTINMKALESRYEVENQFLKAISQGLHHKAELMISNISSTHFEQRAMDPIRNLQNYCIIMNTLLRKAAETGSVHPLYVDRLSSSFARKIETLTSREGVAKLQREMVHKYCLLVKNHSMKGFSLLVQKIIIRIDSDLTADLSLNAMAEELNVNASYLSNLFKKEIGSTLTEYVNRKRVEHSILLLNTATLQIQTIAQHCGIPDVNYFTKIFKKIVGKTPREYREDILRG
jgi:two-component system, response regulator YesN